MAGCRGNQLADPVTTRRRARFWLACALAAFGCVALAITAVVAIGAGGYRPEQYAQQPDPVRAGLITFLVSSTLAFGLFAADSLAALRSGSDGGSLAAAFLHAGLVVMGGSLLTLMIWAPETPGPHVVPAPTRLALIVGVTLAAFGFLPGAAAGTVDAVKRRDRSLLVGVALLAAAIAFAVLLPS